MNEKNARVTLALDYWAAYQWHLAASGKGLPSAREMMLWVAETANPNEETVFALCDSSTLYYDASTGKYERIFVNSDSAIMAAHEVNKLLVENGGPVILIDLLMYFHPTWGRFERTPEAESGDSYRRFRTPALYRWLSPLYGRSNSFTTRQEQTIDTLLRQAYRSFRWQLADRLEGRQCEVA
jgi:hypothetical protein